MPPMATDINPHFSFDLDLSQAPVEAAWEFRGALDEARRERAASKQTSIDQKIAQHLQSDPSRKIREPVRGKRKAPEPAADEDGRSDEEDLSSEDAPLPGEEDTEDSDESDAETVQHGNAEDLMDEAEESEDDEDMQTEPVSKGTGSVPGSTADNRKAPEAPGPADGGDETAAAEEAQALQQRSHAAAAPSGLAAAQDGQKRPAFYAQTPDGTRFSAGSFNDLHLSRPLLKACTALGYTNPTPIQAACIPLALAGRDICGSAITGSGKTAAFALPLLERLLYRNKRLAATYALVLTPTRELAVQVHSMVTKLAQFTDIRAALIVGGLSLSVQAATLRTSPEILVATPGRLIDHLRNTQSVGLEDLQALVLDEADRLLQMGFAEEIKEVLRLTPRKRQTLLFSATMTEEVRDLAALSLQRPVRLAADAAGAAPKTLQQEIVRLKGAAGAAAKEGTLLALCAKSFRGGKTIVFFATKHSAHRAKILFGLAQLPPSAELHGNMTQAARLESLERFRKGEVAFLLATDVAARGLDITGVEAVVNYDPPGSLSGYLHRIGRTARAGSSGRAVTFADDSTRPLLKEVVKKAGAKLQIRVVQPALVEHWSQRIRSLARDVSRINEEEREEMELRKAEMEAAKAENMVEHEAEINARPARTWFQTRKEKEASTTRAREGETGKAGESEGAPAKGKKAAKEAQRAQRKQEDRAAEKQRNRNQLLQETAAVAGKIRAVKSKASQLRQEGMTGTRAGQAAVAAVSAVKRKKQKAKKGKGQAMQSPGGVSNSGAPERPMGKVKVYPGGGKSGKLKQTLSKTQKPKGKKHAAGKHGSFKSKGKHKRR
ncbi:hypothetical protein CVIRNUC_006164 [Coccomyxa viridis]|uniref:DEAD-box ATP-dependent RNA helicase 28 n=1 Tax=Coccomyxa viridis TaxID=1274662 RepID=A0AAV1I6H0_9CHLO|nr:hypothetical protein CVIRNUC_006164 [Coccomyxa viridis]